MDPVQNELTLFEECVDEESRCQCHKWLGTVCGRSLEGFDSRMKYHPSCRKAVDEARRKLRRRIREDERLRRMKAAAKVFHKNNPHVYNKLVELARELKRRGKKHYGFRCLWENVRFSCDSTGDVEESTGDRFKMNNNYQKFYSTLIMEQEEDLEDFFYQRG